MTHEIGIAVVKVTTPWLAAVGISLSPLAYHMIAFSWADAEHLVRISVLLLGGLLSVLTFIDSRRKLQSKHAPPTRDNPESEGPGST